MPLLQPLSVLEELFNAGGKEPRPRAGEAAHPDAGRDTGDEKGEGEKRQNQNPMALPGKSHEQKCQQDHADSQQEQGSKRGDGHGEQMLAVLLKIVRKQVETRVDHGHQGRSHVPEALEEPSGLG